MHRSSLRLPALCTLVFVLLAPALPCASAEGSWTATPSFASQYLFRGVRLAGPCLQPGLEYAADRWVAGVWGSAPLRSADSAAWETDLYASGTFPVLPDRLDVVPGFTVYAYPKVHRSEGTYPVTAEPNLALNWTVAGVRLTPKLYYDLMLESTTAELAAAYAYPLKDLGTELDFTAAVGTFRSQSAVAGADPAVKNWGDYWLAGVAMPFQLTTRAKVVLGVTYSRGENNYTKIGTEPKQRNELAVGRLAAMVSCSVSL